MGAYPAVQTKLRSILMAHLPSDDNPSLDEILGTKIAYLDGVCEETVRLASPVKAQLRQALVDTQVLGYPVPKGAQIFMNLHLNRPPAPVDEFRRITSSQEVAKKTADGLQSEAGLNLASFDPERWLVKDGKTGKEVFNTSAIPMNAFGGGYRGCAGESDSCLCFQSHKHCFWDLNLSLFLSSRTRLWSHPRIYRPKLMAIQFRTKLRNDGDSDHGSVTGSEF